MDGPAMRVSFKKVLQAGTIISLTAYMTLLLRQYAADGPFGVVSSSGVVNTNSDGRLSSMGFQERLPRALMDSSQNNNVNNINNGGLSLPDGVPFHADEAAAAFRYGHGGEVVVSDGKGDKLSANSNHNKYNRNHHKQTQLEDLFISVKTTKNFHQSRLDVLLRTWFVLARDQTYFFTDGEDESYQQKTNGHLINTNCSSSHNRKALCCKMSVEFDKFLESNKRWFCHFDDDNYVNVPQLLKLLQKYNPTEDWYLGKPSIRAPLEILNRDNFNQKISFWFATGGAGFCLSRALALKMMPLASDGKFISIGEKIRLPDDVTMGYIIEHLLNKRLTVVDQFHSHLEPMKFIKQESFPDQITFSYSRYGKETNTLTIDGFDVRIDPTRFLSLHCYLFPNFSFCPR